MRNRTICILYCAGFAACVFALSKWDIPMLGWTAVPAYSAILRK